MERYRHLLNDEEAARLAKAMQHPPLTAVRANTLKVDIDHARAAWPVWHGWEVRQVPFCAAGWQLTDYEQEPGHTLEHKMGLYYIQDAASMLPVELFTPHDAPLVLDMAASPGGKTTHLASHFNDRAAIIANDRSARRIKPLRLNLQKYGAAGAMVTNYPGERFGAWFPDMFDRVLLDAPCSGDTLLESKRHKAREVSEAEREALSRRQTELLLSAFQAAQPGGEVVYSTCTLAPEENEAVLDALLTAYPGAAEVEAVQIEASPGCTCGAAYHPDVRRAVRLWPHLYQTLGFFAARLRKLDSVPAAPEDAPARAIAVSQVTRHERAHIAQDLYDAYGVDLEALLQAHGLALWRRGESVYAIFELLLAHFGALPHLTAGLMVGEYDGARFTPYNELVTRFRAAFTEGWLTLPETESAIWQEGRDLRGMDAPYAPGSVILLQDARGRFLGRGKVLPKRIRNLLPRHAVY